MSKKFSNMIAVYQKKLNPIAKEVRTPKYKQRIVKNKKKKKNN